MPYRSFHLLIRSSGPQRLNLWIGTLASTLRLEFHVYASMPVPVLPSPSRSVSPGSSPYGSDLLNSWRNYFFYPGLLLSGLLDPIRFGRETRRPRAENGGCSSCRDTLHR